MKVLKGLIIKQPWIDLILSGEKTWEMRSNGVTHRGPFGLILKGSKKVVGVAELVRVHGPLTDEELRQSFDRHQVPGEMLKGSGRVSWNYAWVLANARRLQRPVPYTHKSEVRWVLFEPNVADQIREQLQP